MKHEEFDSMVDKSHERQIDLLERKGADYCHSDDRLDFFKEVAEDTGSTPAQATWILAKKHLLPILKWIKGGKIESEGLEGRFDDLHNYLYFLEAIFREGGADRIWSMSDEDFKALWTAQKEKLKSLGVGDEDDKIFEKEEAKKKRVQKAIKYLLEVNGYKDIHDIETGW